jgi:hypothetical protein
MKIKRTISLKVISTAQREMEKALSHKYIRKIPKNTGKGWYYIYKESFLKLLNSLKAVFGIHKAKIIDDYEKNNIKKEFGADKKTFAAHVLEYLSNKLKWDNFFSKKENRISTVKPVKMKIANTGAVKLGTDGQGELTFDKKPKKTNTEISLNRSLMRKVYNIYNEPGANENERQDNAGTGRSELPLRSTAIRDGGSKKTGDLNVPETGDGTNQGEPGELPSESGIRPGGNVRGRRGRSAIKSVREQAKKLLSEKSDNEMTEADKDLLRQYEGAGGLNEAERTTHGTLYEFYTPQKVVDKVWSLVDKYKPYANKDVIEPSAGTGRFAEGRQDNFTLCELDETSSRIARILHPKAEVRQGYFQELFMSGNTPKKSYDGKKYDVAIGNPPYGAYSGLHRGLGEGKEHSRIEEYFIDRSLDTLKDGGILAMVVPSSFLRGKNSKAKVQIAKKGKLLEAWRLPNGTFGTTGVGTDIIVIRKGPGDANDYQNDIYFQKNEDKIAGTETERMGKFGLEKYVAPPDGMTFDEALEFIDPAKVPVSVEGEKLPQEAAKEKIEVNAEIGKIEASESEAEKHDNRSQAMRGNQNAKKDGVQEDNVQNQIKDINAKIRELEKNQRADYKMAQMQDKLDEDILAFQAREAGKTKQKEIDELKRQKAELTARLPKESPPAPGAQPPKEGKKRTKKGDEYTPSIGKNMTADEFNAKYGKNTDKADLPVWKVTDYTGRVDIGRLSPVQKRYVQESGKYVVDVHGNWVSRVNYASGNIYEKLDQLEADKDLIVRTMGEGVYKNNRAILESAMPVLKKADNFTIPPTSDFAKEYNSVDEDGNVVNIRSAFFRWAKINMRNETVDWNSSPISKLEIPPHITMNDIIDYINQVPVRIDRATAREYDKKTARMEADKKREERREAAEGIFTRFIREGISPEERAKLENAWNRRFNAIVSPDYTQIPLFIEGMNTHKGKKEFELTAQQLKGISFVSNKGNGVVAYDVGIGKTVVGAAATVNQIQTGRAKKPLLMVPKAVYKKWIKEVKQHFPLITVNELGNFSAKDLAKYKTSQRVAIKNRNGTHETIEPGGLIISEDSISICTYEALNKVAFKPKTLSGDLVFDMMDSQSIYDEDGVDNRSERQKKQEQEKIMEMLGISAKSKEGSIYWEDTGFDHITVDELHNFKNIFSIPRSFSHSNKAGEDEKGERNANEYSGISGATSARGMKMFAIAQLIQKDNNDRNFFGLTATPFNNSPIEIYNILSLVARKKLKELHIYNMHEFLNQFAELKEEWSVKANGEIEQKQVMKNFKNLTALQNLITEYIDKVDGEEAGVIRPKKKVHLPELELTPLQKAIIAAETERMSNADPKEDPGAYLKAINNMRMAVLSPALVDSSNFSNYAKFEGFPDDPAKWPKPDDIVTGSPKLKFICDSIVKAYKEAPKNGQIIYMPRGVEQYSFVKDYLVAQGMPAESIAFMNSSTSLDAKENIKNDFNDEDGKIKVIIGSETIKEGVSLNGNTPVLYNAMLGWNPTETLQVEGRAHRQGNKQGHVHIVYPLMVDSIDSLMYQKYDEKSSRLNALWSYKGDNLNVEDVNPAELKFDLIKDPQRKAKFKIGLLKEEIGNKKRIEEVRYDVLFKDSQLLEQAKNQIIPVSRNLMEAEENMKNAKAEYDAMKKDAEKLKKQGPYDENRVKRALEEEKWNYDQKQSYYKMYKKSAKEIQNTIDAFTAKLTKIDLQTPEQIESRLKSYTKEISRLKQESEKLDKQFDFYVAEAKKEIELSKKKLPPISEQIERNVRSIMGDLRPMNEVEKEIMAERGIKKAFSVVSKRIIRISA